MERKIETESWTSPERPNPVFNAMLEAAMAFKYIAEYPTRARRFSRWQRKQVPGTWYPNAGQIHSMYHVYANMVTAYAEMSRAGIQTIPTPETAPLLDELRRRYFADLAFPDDLPSEPEPGPSPYL